MIQKYLALATVAVSLLTKCTSLTSADNVRCYIPGAYARAVKNEFSIGNDTLFIAELSGIGNNYRIIHKISFQRIKDGKPVKIERKQEVWNAVYNEQEKMLHETVHGKFVSFNPEGRTLFVGTSEYKKISK